MTTLLNITTRRSISALRYSNTLCQARRCKFKKADTHVYLLKAVDGLGERGDIVEVGLGHARNYLVPFKLAYYVPRLRGKAVLPSDWKPNAQTSQDDIAEITPAIWSDTSEIKSTEKSVACNESLSD
ncbi:hypothetical protein SeLEV6574_g05242 [Synchytrium endobioticum]|uniref:Ribosomal protein L9 domain-containing protein n=1 Tax=Synchytrium endobioticum TaxID=286115 RepID=A0A507CVP8_9FUNG|nr:hypothetical protein SeLEV6574_g05242 [Synchytrium endobioticum]